MINERLFAHAAKPAVAWATLTGALVVLASVETALAEHWGLWIDELYSLWTTRTDIPTAESLARIHGDSNPPLYFALLRIVRAFVSGPHAAIVLLNSLLLLAAGAFVLAVSWRRRVFPLALFGLAAFILSGPVFFFVQEGRSYFLGLCLAFATSWCVALAVTEDGDRRIGLWTFASLGVLAAVTHPFSALLAGGMAAGLVVHGLASKRSELARAGLVLGAAASVTFLTWLATAFGRLGNVAWMEFTPEAVRTALWYVRHLSIGPALMAAPLAAFLCVLALLPRTRPIATVFAIAGVLFVALPLAVSFVAPLINGRYWLIGAPALTVALVFLADALFAMTGARSRVGGLAVVVFLAAAAIAGFFSARHLLAIEPAWTLADDVRDLAAGCEAHSIRVVRSPSLYAQASGLPQSTFIENQVAGGAEPSSCPVIAWYEHAAVGVIDVREAPDALLLQQVGLSPDLAGLRIVKHASGYMVVREADD